MPSVEFHSSVSNKTDIKTIEDPYCKVRVDAIANDWLHHSHFFQWTYNHTPDTITKYVNLVEEYDKTISYKVKNKKTKKTTTKTKTVHVVPQDFTTGYEDTWLGIKPTSNNTSIEFTKTISFPRDGWYRVEIIQNPSPSYGGTITTTIDNIQLGDVESCWNRFPTNDEVIQYPTKFYKAGNHNFKVTLTRGGYLASMTVYNINRFEGGTGEETSSNNTRLDIISGEFTQNSVNEINTLTLNCVMKEEYLDPYSTQSLLKFDQFDSVTLWLGNDYLDTKPMFGGYIISASVESGQLKLTCVDRLLDMRLTPVYMNFKIGNPSITEVDDKTPVTSFSNVYDLARTLANAPEYPIKSYMVPLDYGFYESFDTLEEFTKINGSKYTLEWDTKFGNPKPSLKVGIGNETGTGNIIFYNNSDGYDAHDYGYFNLSYYLGAMGLKEPLTFNIKIQMHRTGQTISDARTYTIHFNQTSGQENTITSVTPLSNGNFNHITLDLKALFDKNVKSDNYTITKIWMEGNITSDMVTNNKGYVIWFDSCYSYRWIANAPNYYSNEVKNPFEELQKLCEDTDHSVYVKYGDERRDDILVMQPVGQNIMDEPVSDASNLIEIESWDYNPHEDPFVNNVYKTFSFESNETVKYKKKNKKTGRYVTKTKTVNKVNTGHTYVIDHDSRVRYRRVQTYENINDTISQATLDSKCNTELRNGAWKYPSFTVTIRGSTILEPSQYVMTMISTQRLNQVHLIKSITHRFDLQKNTFTTQIDLNRPSKLFKNTISKMRKQLKMIGFNDGTRVYMSNNLSQAAATSTGAYQ